MGANADLVKLMGPELELLLPVLDEKARRLALGAVARAAGDGGVTAVAKMTGASWQTVADGAAEPGSGRSRRRGASAGRAGAARSWPGPVPGWCRRCWRWWRIARAGILSRRWRGRPGALCACRMS